MFLFPLVSFVSLAAATPAPPPVTPARYTIRRATGPIGVDGKLDEADWKAAPLMSPFVFRWWTAGDKEPTEARMLWDDENLYVAYHCHDRHISAFVTQRHGPVSRDDCVEIFLSPNPEKVKNYYTFEINCVGTMLNRCRTDWWQGPPTWEPEGVKIGHSIPGPTKEESPSDEAWIIELAIPLRNFSFDAAHTPPHAGDVWRLNLNRCGGQTNLQFSSWSPIGTEKPSFHSPDYFGYVTFSDQRVR
jgi:hypothetical protein